MARPRLAGSEHGGESPRTRNSLQFVRSAVLENEGSAGDEVLHGSGDEDFAWLSHGGEPGSDGDGDAGELAVQPLALSGVHAGPDLEPERWHVVHERQGALDRAAGTVECGEEAVTCRVELVAPEFGEAAAHGRVVPLE